MNYNLETTTGIHNLYNNVNNTLSKSNPAMLVILTVVIIIFYGVSSFSSVQDSVSLETPASSVGVNIIEVLMWALLLFLLLINGLQYFFEIDVQASVRKIFSPEPEVDINITSKKDSEPVPEIKLEKQVFHVPDNKYTFEESKALCKAYGGRLASYDEIENAHKEGAEWCGYGWSKDQLALFPTQSKTYDALQKIEGHENDCGRPGINGGFIDNPNVRFGANCFGYKPKMTSQEMEMMNQTHTYPKTEKDKRFDRMVQDFKRKLPDILVAPFNNTTWSVI